MLTVIEKLSSYLNDLSTLLFHGDIVFMPPPPAPPSLYDCGVQTIVQISECQLTYVAAPLKLLILHCFMLMIRWFYI